MIDTTATTIATAEQVWAVLGDGWEYSGWVVGAARVRRVEDGWPAAGTSVHHSVGAWPFLLDDSTTVEQSTPRSVLVLRARARPLIEAVVRIELRSRPDGCEIRLREEIVRGPLSAAPTFLRRWFLQSRNRESLRRLAWAAEGVAVTAATR